ncbi:translation initiation factor IF-2 [Streptomyces sp. KO7888]|nr:translation initiation factor IF-2 [Streptomyces sp. KO7888]
MPGGLLGPLPTIPSARSCRSETRAASGTQAPRNGTPCASPCSTRQGTIPTGPTSSTFRPGSSSTTATTGSLATNCTRPVGGATCCSESASKRRTVRRRSGRQSPRSSSLKRTGGSGGVSGFAVSSRPVVRASQPTKTWSRSGGAQGGRGFRTTGQCSLFLMRR